MDSYLSRRSLLRAAVAAPAVVQLGTNRATAQQIAPNPNGAWLSNTRAAFEAEFGSSRKDAGFDVYDFSPYQQATYWVRYNANDLAEYIEIDYTALPGGGLAFDKSTLGQSQFIYVDPNSGSRIGAGGSLGHLHNDRSVFWAEVHMSDWRRTMTGGNGYALVMDAFRVSGAGAPIPSPLTQTFISIESPEVYTIATTGGAPGIRTPLEDWNNRFGILPTNRGYMLQHPPIAGTWHIGVQDTGGATHIDASFSTPMSTQEAAYWIGQMVEAPRGTVCSFWLPPSPNGGIGLRVHVFATYRYEYAVSVQYVTGGEAAGTVDRIMIVHSAQYGYEGY